MKLADRKCDAAELAAFAGRIEACRLCRDAPQGTPLPHEPRPVLRISTTARICICGQAPGTRVHASGTPFTDPSGDRLRDWMGVSEAEFYDESRIAIVPLGFCFPGLDEKGGDLPPRKECAPAWRAPLFEMLPQFELILLVGQYAQRWHLGSRARRTLTETVENWRAYVQEPGPTLLPLPHPSWRNNAWIKRNPWFGEAMLPYLRKQVRQRL
jgi:uracil-DNA glycosylase